MVIILAPFILISLAILGNGNPKWRLFGAILSGVAIALGFGLMFITMTLQGMDELVAFGVNAFMDEEVLTPDPQPRYNWNVIILIVGQIGLFILSVIHGTEFQKLRKHANTPPVEEPEFTRDPFS